MRKIALPPMARLPGQQRITHHDLVPARGGQAGMSYSVHAVRGRDEYEDGRRCYEPGQDGSFDRYLSRSNSRADISSKSQACSLLSAVLGALLLSVVGTPAIHNWRLVARSWRRRLRLDHR